MLPQSKCENLERQKKAEYLIVIMFQIKTTDCISQTASEYRRDQNKQLGRKIYLLAHGFRGFSLQRSVLFRGHGEMGLYNERIWQMLITSQ